MSSIKRCPSCQLAKPKTASLCDCGHYFKSMTIQETLLGNNERRVSRWARLATFITDASLIQIVYFLCILANSSLTRTAPLAAIKFTIPLFGYCFHFRRSLFLLAITFLYYFLFEYFAQRTPGKFLTGSRVVSIGGDAASARDICIRTLSRFLPFETFSVFRASGRGWHDSWSGTKVINEDAGARCRRSSGMIWTRHPMPE